MKRAILGLVVATLASMAHANVFNMGGTQNADGSWNGLASLEMVPVGNPGNAADIRYNLDKRPEGYGAVDYVYQIGKYEVTNAQYVEFLNAVATTDTYGLYNTNMWDNEYGCKIARSGSSGSYTYSVAADRANRPVNYVSFWDAARFANWLHNGQGDGDTESGAYINIGNQTTFARQPGAKWWIPSEDEWYKAAYHKNDGVTGNYWDYPTGTNAGPSNDLVDPDPGNNANFFDGSYTLGSPYWTTVVGEFENSESPYNTFDQGGNLHEWNETAFGSSRGVRGGWYVAGGMHASNRGSVNPTNEDNFVGFRVASVPEPSTIALLAAGAIALLALAKRSARGCLLQ